MEVEFHGWKGNFKRLGEVRSEPRPESGTINNECLKCLALLLDSRGSYPERLSVHHNRFPTLSLFEFLLIFVCTQEKS